MDIEGFCDLGMLLPSLLTDDDIETIINRNMNLTGAVLEDKKLFSVKYLEKCTLLFKEDIA